MNPGDPNPVSRPMLHNSIAMQAARILSRHGQCIAMGPSLDFEHIFSSDETTPSRSASQQEAIGSWLDSHACDLDELSPPPVSVCVHYPEYGRLRTAPDQFVDAWMVMVEFGGIRVCLAFEAVP